MNLSTRRRWMGLLDIKMINFRPIRYICEIHNNICPICLETMNIFKCRYSFRSCDVFRGCDLCTFWAHKQCVDSCNKCPQCRKQWYRYQRI